jgi:hypothetical protein
LILSLGLNSKTTLICLSKDSSKGKTDLKLALERQSLMARRESVTVRSKGKIRKKKGNLVQTKNQERHMNARKKQ